MKLSLAMGAFFVVTSVSFAERRIAKSDLPALVAKTADAHSAGGTVVGYSKDVKTEKWSMKFS
jgi:hypothetical protein